MIIAVAAMYIVSRKVDWHDVRRIEWGCSLLWLLPAFICYNLSQCISAYRLLQYYKVFLPAINYLFNLRLYYRGMFYNLFLPGGIGGDAYKIVALKNSSNTYRQLTTATLMDRVTGLGVLIVIITTLSLLVPIQGLLDDFFSILPMLVITGVPAYYLVVWYYFKPFHHVLPTAASLSLLVQGFQMLCFFCILVALKIDTDPVLVAAFLFFTSSVIAAMPVSIGGIGTRELAIATGALHFQFSPAKMVTASLIFFLLVVMSSLMGWLINVKESRAASLDQKT